MGVKSRHKLPLIAAPGDCGPAARGLLGSDLGLRLGGLGPRGARFSLESRSEESSSSIQSEFEKSLNSAWF